MGNPGDCVKPTAILLTRNDGVIVEANAAARELLGHIERIPCFDAVRSVADEGGRVCTQSCTGDAGEQVDHGVVRVRGKAMRLLCSKLSESRVITLVPAPAAETGGDSLSPREKEVLQLVARGFTTHRVARRLGVSPSTARTHVEHIRDKLGVRTRSQAVAKALAMGEID
jgi:DNA-binding CsgD family transcriptional regulator